MRVSNVLLVSLILGCGGGGSGDAYGPAGPGSGTGTGTGTGTGSGSGTNPSASATVTMQAGDDGYGSATFSFAPATVTITSGGSVTWTHDGSAVTHNVTFESAPGVPANVANMSAGQASRTFNTAGSFSYSCTNHAGMAGTVNVR